MIYLSICLARERKTGKVQVLARATNDAPGETAADVPAAFRGFSAPGKEGDALRSRFSSVMFMIDNTVRESIDLPDPAELARAAKAKQIAEAKAKLAGAESVASKAQAASDAAAAAAAEVAAARAALAALENPGAKSDKSDGSDESGDSDKSGDSAKPDKAPPASAKPMGAK